MECQYFGVCGSCSSYEGGYSAQLQRKIENFQRMLNKQLDVYSSLPTHFRARAEFRIVDGKYAMHRLDKKGLLPIDECKIVLKPIYNLMPKLLDEIKKDKVLFEKLFRVDFLSGLSGEILITLVYHKMIDKEWREAAKELQKKFDILIIGRSRGVKEVLVKEYILEQLPIADKEYLYHHYEGSFTQPNPFVNIKMIEWVLEKSKEFRGDLLELYCGAGNFTIPLAQNFSKILATEVSKTSVRALKENIVLNNIDNIFTARLSSSEVAEAIEGKRSFRRLADINLSSFDFSTLFVDPPRSGLDTDTLKLAQKFENIIYISCNPLSLKRDIEALKQTHSLQSIAIFDQFPYTYHLESGIILKKIRH